MAAVLSGHVSHFPPPDIIFTLITFLASQLIWYWYQISGEYEEIERKILLETSQSNIHNLINAVPEGIVVLDKKSEILMKNEAFSLLLQENEFYSIKLMKKYNFEPVFNENLLECIFGFQESSNKNVVFGVFIIKSVYLECTGAKIK